RSAGRKSDSSERDFISENIARVGITTRNSSDCRPQPAAFSVQHEQRASTRQPETTEGDTRRQEGQCFECRHASQKPELHQVYFHCIALQKQLQGKSQENEALKRECDRLKSALGAIKGNMTTRQQRNDIQL
ncbi:unnamed protein product, partial [Scytosiphon promiscuus]